VRVTYSQNRRAGQWKAHGRYLARDRATSTQGVKAKGVTEGGFGSDGKTADLSAVLDSWQRAGDERLFKFIVSPEFGERMDFRAHTRSLMARIERDLNTKLEWVAILHFNTEHPHAHIALRGIDEHGMPLRLDPHYIRSGIRNHAEDIATEQLGYRTEKQAAEAQRKEIHQLRYTSLDRVIARHRNEESEHFMVTIDHRPLGREGFAQVQRQHVGARLAALEKMGLAERVESDAWRVRSDFEHTLRTLQRANDHQKMLAAHAALLSDARLPLEVTSLKKDRTLEGRIIAHAQEEYTGRSYMLLEGTDGAVHLVYHNHIIENARHRGRLRVNSFVRLESTVVGNQPRLSIQELGNAHAILKNTAYLRQSAQRLIQQGVLDVEPTWGGWLGEYQTVLRSQLHALQPMAGHDQAKVPSVGR
jgi:type IV secretory pathway VirD2 relaxase